MGGDGYHMGHASGMVPGMGGMSMAHDPAMAGMHMANPEDSVQVRRPSRDDRPDVVRAWIDGAFYAGRRNSSRLRHNSSSRP